ncbi:hypothetical protein LO767_03285 [Halopseudomonas aestusnigri]|uniref:hypothetical protein n=1 Tax=Halopseudomonas aestusnigri TaxID=857252 RepID=UPI001E56CEDA|nr:hypothetical protein [Halopseudomonas aestusnigri]UGV31544.1 hypothetical protein LO767_03285 [Halopseudomonas aestusnigri]
MQDLGVLAVLLLPILIAVGIARALKRGGRPWWLQLLAALAGWLLNVLGVMLIVGGFGVFDGEASVALAVIGALFVAPALYLIGKLYKAPPKQSSPPPPLAKPTTAAKKPEVAPPSPPPKPSRASRNGWQLCRIAFEYEDADGNWTDRQVTVHSVTGAHIKGECHQRRAERTFRLDRILSDITDLDTGEVLSVKKWANAYR